MAIVTTPTQLSFTSIESFRLERYSNVVRSRFTGAGQRVLYPFAVWVLEAKLKEYVEPDATAIRGFLADLQGQANSFRFTVPGSATPSTGVTNGAVLLNAAIAARASSLTLKGLGVGVLTLRKGDYFTIGEELKICLTDATGNGSGQATINFQPPVRLAYSTNAPIKINNPTVLMYASDDRVLDQALRPPVITGITLSAVEAVDV